MRKLLTIILLLSVGLTAHAQGAKKVYKWEDADGNVYYGDSIPAEFAERPKKVLNDQGVSVAELEGKKTAEQREQERIDKERRVAAELQRRADQALLATYLSVDEIIMHRDRRVELFQAQSRVTELYLKNLERRLVDLRTEASRFQPYSNDADAPMIDADLAADLRDTKDTIARHQRNLEKYSADEKRIVDRFDGDIARFKRLKGIETTANNASGSTGT
ncbi:MAG: DUF4124 domain-containing protein [Gammaproteobacteria bacterium]|nr:DUF4124 domain-containing protein [Gammaproteobacteria bacterium]NNF48936.1 DUF4124 domain-containing protein [Woeseiaceae bacterium]MBT8093260.1 DUF4124 domain-containing protein [Gammaproteobacteria bacterium]MBT8106066.1 DUF4124 domain-containing protein [Gammaproteobacteria bacterium]NNK26080.1 DUF4124 domain-containing protein [Woeseiaceae bacterium]